MKRLETGRLILRDFVETDLEDFYTYAKVEGVGERAGWKHHTSIEESKRILDDFIERGECYALVLKENGRVVGSLGVHPDKDEPAEDCREIGYVLAREHWGRGLMSEAVSAVIDHCFGSMGLNRLTCGHFVENDVSRRIIEKSGFTFTGRKPFRSKSLGKDIESLRYELTKHDYLKRKKEAGAG